MVALIALALGVNRASYAELEGKKRGQVRFSVTADEKGNGKPDLTPFSPPTGSTPRTSSPVSSAGRFPLGSFAKAFLQNSNIQPPNLAVHRRIWEEAIPLSDSHSKMANISARGTSDTDLDAAALILLS
jgi:hypothetical protein